MKEEKKEEKEGEEEEKCQNKKTQKLLYDVRCKKLCR